MWPKPADIGREPRKYPVFGMTIVQYRSGQGCFPETFSAGFHFSWCESDTIRDPNPGNGPQSGKTIIGMRNCNWACESKVGKSRKFWAEWCLI
jgi:hypothetical protein